MVRSYLEHDLTPSGAVCFYTQRDEVGWRLLVSFFMSETDSVSLRGIRTLGNR
jgi:hypothetical protein